MRRSCAQMLCADRPGTMLARHVPLLEQQLGSNSQCCRCAPLCTVLCLCEIKHQEVPSVKCQSRGPSVKKKEKNRVSRRRKRNYPEEENKTDWKLWSWREEHLCEVKAKSRRASLWSRGRVERSIFVKSRPSRRAALQVYSHPKYRM